MKKEILPALSLLLAMAFPLSGHSMDKPDHPPTVVVSPTPPSNAAAAAVCGQECQDAYKRYTELVASQKWDVKLYQAFLARFDEVSSDVKVTSESKDLIVGSMPPADWYGSYKYRESQMDKKAAWDGVVTMFQVERADFGRGQAEAEKLYKKLAVATTWKDGNQLKKELGRRLSDLYGKSVLSRGSDGDPLRLFPGAMAAANLRASDFLYVYLGPEGRNSLDSSSCKKDKCAPGLVENIDKRNQLQKKGGKAIADVTGAGLGSGAAADGGAGPKFSERFLKPADSAEASPSPVAADPTKIAAEALKTPGNQLPRGFNLKDRGVGDFRPQTTPCAIGDLACGFKAHPFNLNAAATTPCAAGDFECGLKAQPFNARPAAPNLFQAALQASSPKTLIATAQTEVVPGAADPAVKAKPKPKPVRVTLQPKVKYTGAGEADFGEGPTKRHYDVAQFIDMNHAGEQPQRFGELADGGHLVVSKEIHQPDTHYLSVFDSKGVRTARIRIDSPDGYPKTVSWCGESDCYPGRKAFRTLTVNNPEKNSKYDDDQFLMTLGWDASFQIASDAGTYTHYHDDPKIANDAGAEVSIGLLSGQWQGPMTQK